METPTTILSAMNLLDDLANSEQLKTWLKTQLQHISVDLNCLGLNEENDYLAQTQLNALSTLGANIYNSKNDKKYSFAVFSDIHVEGANPPAYPSSNGRGAVDFIVALSCVKSFDVENICIAGDIGLNAINYSQICALYESCILSAQFSKDQISCAVGNHDQGFLSSQWMQMTGKPQTSYYVEKNNDLFVFMNLKYISTETYGPATQKEPFDISALNWLSTLLDEKPNKRIFVFMHFPLNSCNGMDQYPGLGNYEWKGSNYVPSETADIDNIPQYGFMLYHDSSQTSNNEKLYFNEQNSFFINTFKNYAGHVIVFNGHTHYAFQVEKLEDHIIHKRIFDNVDIFHVPSLNYPRNKSGVSITSNRPMHQPSQGYVVDCFDDKIIVNGYEFNLNITKDKQHADLVFKRCVDTRLNIQSQEKTTSNDIVASSLIKRYKSICHID